MTCFILVLLFGSRYYWIWTQFNSIQSVYCHHCNRKVQCCCWSICSVLSGRICGFRLLFLHPWNGLGLLLWAASCCCFVLLGPHRLNTRSFEEGLHDSCWYTRWKESTQQLTSLQMQKKEKQTRYVTQISPTLTWVQHNEHPTVTVLTFNWNKITKTVFSTTKLFDCVIITGKLR